MSLPFNMLPSFPSKEQVSFNFMASVTVCSDFGAQESKICNNLVFPKYAWSNKLSEISFTIIDPRIFQGDSDYTAVDILPNISR